MHFENDTETLELVCIIVLLHLSAGGVSFL